jgi:hypothetical protein
LRDSTMAFLFVSGTGFERRNALSRFGEA